MNSSLVELISTCRDTNDFEQQLRRCRDTINTELFRIEAARETERVTERLATGDHSEVLKALTVKCTMYNYEIVSYYSVIIMNYQITSQAGAIEVGSYYCSGNLSITVNGDDWIECDKPGCWDGNGVDDELVVVAMNILGISVEPAEFIDYVLDVCDAFYIKRS